MKSNSIKGILLKCLWNTPKCLIKNYIIFESVPDLSDNTFAVFEEMLRQDVEKRYKFVQIVEKWKKEYQDKYPNVLFISKDSKRKWHYLLRAKCLICCNQIYPSFNKHQYSVYLSHGLPIKKLSQVAKTSDKLTNMFTFDSDVARRIMAREFNFPMNRIMGIGLPRNDILTYGKIDIHSFFPGKQFNKAVIWYPTFRQNKGDISASDSIIALPIIHDEASAKRVNECACRNGILIILKPHFAQDTSYFKGIDLPNIVIIDDAFFNKNKCTSYEFVASCDALLTDYSSIYYDYLLADKPIGLIWEDIEQYTSRPGFADEVMTYLDGGEKIYNVEEFLEFLGRIANEEDVLSSKRRMIKKEICGMASTCSKEVLDFILEKAGL